MAVKFTFASKAWFLIRIQLGLYLELNVFSTVFFLQIFGHQNPESRMDPDRYSA
jgi:hypothetical protein